MKKILFIILTIALLTACGEKKENVKEADTSIEVIDRAAQENINIEEKTTEVENYDISAVADYNENKLRKECYIDKVKYIGDPDLEELYGNLVYYQEKADEWAKFPRELDELREISGEIGTLKGEIQFRSLEVYSKVN